MGISSINSISASAAQSVYTSNANKAVIESPQTSTSRTTSGDTVQISDEARSSLQSTQASDTTGSSGTGGSKATASAAGGSPIAGSSSSTSSSNADVIAKLEKEIRALQQDMTALVAKALTDDKARSELNARQAELGGLMAQLTQLQLQQA
jgi:hypothetical protein